MEHDILGYLMHGLEPDEERVIEAHLESDPQARGDLTHWRGMLNPLRALPQPEPPPMLFINTLRSVAGHMVQVRGPNFPGGDSGYGVATHWWRRADVLVAAAVILVLGLLVPPVLMYLRHKQAIVACQNNLQNLHRAFFQYAEKNGGAFPLLSELPVDYRLAGMTPVLLREKQCWEEGMSLICPGAGGEETWRPANRDEVRAVVESRCDPGWRERLGGQYAYPLGYLQDKNLVSLRRDMGDGIPYLADRPPREHIEEGWDTANSPNHGGKGQNVLFLGGNVRWVTVRAVNDDDIYLNAHGKLAAGVSKQDIVLGPSEARPMPAPASD